MNIDCRDLDSVLRRDDPEVQEALRAHADGCPDCRERLRLWNEISSAAPSLRKEWESPDLWPGIHQRLAAESQTGRNRSGAVRPLLLGIARHWATATALLVLVSGTLAWVLLSSHERPVVRKQGSPAEVERRLLTEQALQEIEQSEAAYVRSIEKLAELAEPKVEASESPLMLSYREKLMLIDSSINECRRNIELNPFNAHLRQELLTMYREKQETLEEVTGGNFNEHR